MIKEILIGVIIIAILLWAAFLLYQLCVFIEYKYSQKNHKMKENKNSKL